MRLRSLAALALSLCCARADAEPELARHFAKQADLTVAHDGLVMLVLPPEVLTATRADLSDLRISDREGRVVPFFVEASRPPSDSRPRLAATVRHVERSLDTPDGTSPSVRERYVLAPIDSELDALGLGASPASSSSSPHQRWALTLAPQAQRFVRSARVETKAEDGSRTLLVESAPLFRIDGAERTQIVLPPHTGELVVTLEGRESDYVGGKFQYVPLPAAFAATPAIVPLRVRSLDSKEGVTTLTIERPLGLVPDALRFETSASTFARRARVRDPRPGGELTEVGAGTLVRVPGDVQAESLEIGLAEAARGEALHVEIEDRDSPPLAELRALALVRRPALVFALPSHGDGLPDGTLHFGGGQTFRPVYDVASLAELVSNPGRLERTLASLDPADVTIEASHDNPAFEPTPALAFAMQPGAAVDTRSFSHRRSLRVTPTENGLSRLRLSPEDIAAARPDLADLRVVGADELQWPFLLAAEAAREWREATIGEPHAERGESRYAVALPSKALGVEALELETDTPFFDRAFRVVARNREGDERTLASGRIVQEPKRPQPARIALRGEHVGALELRIDDGDDAPLRFTRASLRIVLPELFVTAPPGQYWLLLGDEDAMAPRYELERVRELVLAVPSGGCQAGALEPNPTFSATRELASGVRGRTLLVWCVLAGAVAALALLTLRAARSEGTDESKPAS